MEKLRFDDDNGREMHERGGGRKRKKDRQSVSRDHFYTAALKTRGVRDSLCNTRINYSKPNTCRQWSAGRKKQGNNAQ